MCNDETALTAGRSEAANACVDRAFSLNLKAAKELRAALEAETCPQRRNALSIALRLNSKTRDLMLDRL